MLTTCAVLALASGGAEAAAWDQPRSHQPRRLYSYRNYHRRRRSTTPTPPTPAPTPADCSAFWKPGDVLEVASTVSSGATHSTDHTCTCPPSYERDAAEGSTYFCYLPEEARGIELGILVPLLLVVLAHVVMLCSRAPQARRTGAGKAAVVPGAAVMAPPPMTEARSVGSRWARPCPLCCKRTRRQAGTASASRRRR